MSVTYNDYDPNYMQPYDEFGNPVDMSPYRNMAYDLTPSSAGLLGNFDDEASWENYLKVLQLSNDYNSAAMNANFAFNEHMRDTQISSFMNQLKEQGINPILAVSNGVSLPGYSSGSTAQAYSGTSPYSNSSRVDAAIIRAVGSIIGDVINGVFGNSAAAIRAAK